jgi:hypothetical protein
MCRRLIYLISFVLVLALCMMSTAQAADIILVTEDHDYDEDGIQDDQGLVDWLVAEGHTVDVQRDKWVTFERTTASTLNRADLIILSRTTSSGNYDDDNEPTQWNSIKTPMILMSAYPVRSSHWKWVDSTSVIGEGGAPILEAVDLEHPIFTNVPLDENNQVQIVDPAIGSGHISFVDAAAVGNGILIAQTEPNDLPWIVEWDAGVEFYDGAGQVPAGKRLMFFAGTQEIEGTLTPYGAWNFTAEGEILFRNAISYMLGETIVPIVQAPPELLGHWKLDDGEGMVAVDSSGNGNDGVLVGDPQWVAGMLDGALDFDGDGDYLDCGDDPSLNVTDAVTVSAWIKLSAPASDIKVGGNQDGSNGGYKMSLYSDKVEFEIRTAANSAILNRSVAGGTELAVDVWYHVAGVYSLARGYIRTYVDGVLDRELLTTEALGASTGTFKIGCEPFTPDSYNFTGIVDDIRVYDQALTEGKVKEVMAAGPGVVTNFSFEYPGTEKQAGFDNVPGWNTDEPVGDSGVETGWIPTDGEWTAYLMGADPPVWQLTGHTIQNGDIFELKVDARITWLATTLRMSLYYDDEGVRVPLASSDLALTEEMQEYTLSFLANSVRASLGKKIGIEFDNVSDVVDDNWLGLDNVRLEISGSPQPMDPGTEGLVAYYALENDANDSSGNELHGTLVGDPVFVEGVAGMALDFDGDGDYVDCGTNDVLNNLSDAITVSAWVSIRSVTTTWMGIVMKGETAWRLGVNGDTTGIHWGFTGGDRDWQQANSVTELPFDEWHHIAGTYDKNVGGIIYVDGVAEAENPDPNGLSTNEMPLLLGENPEATGRFYDGLLDEVRIYDRALSVDEIRYLRGERPTPIDPGTNGLVAFYALENDVNDSSGNENHGTVFGDPTYVDGPAGYGMAMEFDGDDYVDTGNTEDLATWTIACWAKSPAAPSGDSPSGPVHREKNYQFNWNHSDNTFRGSVSVSAGGWHAAKYGPVEADTWYHLAGTYDGEELKAYKDGALITTNDAPSGPPVAETGTLKLGRHATAEQYFTGTVDEAVIYNRSLTAGEVRYLAGFRPPVDAVTEGLVAYYKLENNTEDSSGNGLNGTIVGNPTYVEGPAGYDMAMEFDGESYVDCGNDPILDITGPISMAIWIRPGTDGSVETAPLCKADASAGWSWQLRYGWNTDKPTIMGFQFNATGGRVWVYVDQELAIGQWYHIAASHDGATVKCYLDGVETDSAPMTDIAGGPSSLLIGSDGWRDDWIGAIDEVMIYDRALSADEVLGLAGQ